MKAFVMPHFGAAVWTSYFRALAADRAQSRHVSVSRNPARRDPAFTTFWLLHAR